MQDKVIFEYAVIRWVPRVEREEFVNIGVIVMSQSKKYLDVKYHLNHERLKCLSSDVDLPFLEGYLQSWKVICAGSTIGNGVESLDLHLRFRWLTANRSTIIQCSPVHSGLCDNPAEQLEVLFEKFVL